MKIALRIGWKTEKSEGGHRVFEAKPMYRGVDLPFVPRVGDHVELWDGEYRQVAEVVVPTSGGLVILKFGDYAAYVWPDDAAEALRLATAEGWTEDHPDMWSRKRS